jgi:hypothetical protein
VVASPWQDGIAFWDASRECSEVLPILKETGKVQCVDRR